MSTKTEVLGTLDERLEHIERKIKRFEHFGNKSNPQELIKYAMNLSWRSELNMIKNDLSYGVDWKQGGKSDD